MGRCVVFRNIKQIVECFSVFYVLLHWTSVGVNAGELCSEQESVDITNATMNGKGIFEHQGVLYNSSQYFQIGKVRRGCICLVRQCIYVCDAANITSIKMTELYANVSDASGNSNRMVNLAKDAQYHLVLGESHCEGNWLQLEVEHVHITSNGQLKLHETLFNYPLFCMLPKDEMGEFRAAYCEPETSDLPHKIYAIGFLLSLPFLVVTFVVYAILPVMQNLQGLLIMSYVAALAVSYLLLALGHLDIYGYQSVMCGICGYTLYFTLIASFFWLNIISFDIYWTFRGNRGWTSERRKSVYYSLYAWGVPLLLLLLILLFDHTELISYNLRPNVGEEGCFLKEEKLTQFLYLYLPLLVVISANIYFFAITAKRIYQTVQANVIMMIGNPRNHVNYEKDRNRFGLYLRWFIVTSVAWSLELISWVVTEPNASPFWVIYLLDVFNCLAGVVIFFLFVWNQRVKKLLIQRFNYSISSHNLNRSHSMSSIVSSYVAEGNRVALTTIVSSDVTHGIIPKGIAPAA